MLSHRLYGAFFLSGAGALGLEAVWFSQAGLVVGNSVWSAALVVAAFMAGLALGNALAIVLARRWRNLVRGYALVELVAGVSGALLVVAFPYLPALLGPLLAGLVDQPAALNAARLAIAFGLMAIPATALGATLPLLARPLEGATGSYGLALGRLYGFNTLGALAGVLLAELLLVPMLGLRMAGIAAAGCNLAAAAVALGLSPRFPAAALQQAAPDASGSGRILAGAFLAGAALLALEVVWFRFLLLFVDGTTLVFAVMLAVVLGGIGLGGMAGARLARRGRLSAAAAQVAAAAAAALAVGGYAFFDVARGLAGGVLPLALFLMAPVALLSGVLFTALGALLRQRIADASAATGMLTVSNTLGAMLGSLAAAFVLLPFLGMEASFFLLALAYALLVVAIPAEAHWLPRVHPTLVAALAVALFPFGKMAGTFYRDVEQRFDARLVEARESLAQSTFYLSHDFLGEPLFFRLATNSYSMASTAVGIQRYTKLFAWLPGTLHPRIESVLVLCFGVGSTASAVTDLPDVKAIDVVDVSRDILEMSDIVYPDASRHPLRDPRVTTHVEDARFFLQTTSRRYDLITGEPPPPKIAGVAPLYTLEYFELMKSRLNPGGIATYWLPGYLLLESEALAIIRAFCEAFEDCSLWSGIGRDWILMGSRGGIAPVPRERFARFWRLDTIGTELQRLGIDSPAQLVAQFMADAGALREFSASIPPLVDDHPRRIRPSLYAEREAPAYATLMDVEGARQRLETSAWAAILPLPADPELFRRRGMLDAMLYPPVRPPNYSVWDDVASLYRRTNLVELPRWLLRSGARVAQIAARHGATDPLAAEHLAIDALANRRAPLTLDRERFNEMTPWGQTVMAFHHCLAGEPARAHELVEWMRQAGRPPEPGFLAWASRECGGANSG